MLMFKTHKSEQLQKAYSICQSCCNTTQQSLFVLLTYAQFIAKILEIKLEYWLPGITIGASGARQPVDMYSVLNENK